MLDIRRALGFIPEDEQARPKLATGLLFLLVPIVNLVVLGYEVQVVRRVARGEERPLPAWDDLGELFVLGARLSLAHFIYGLPFLAAVFGGGFTGLVLALQAAQSSDQAFWQRVGPYVWLGGICLLGGAFVYALGYRFVSPAILAQYAQRGTLGACFDFAALWRFIRRAPGQYLKLWFVDAAIGLGLALLGSLVGLLASAIPCVGWLVDVLVIAAITFFIMLLNGHLVGQLLRARHPLLIKET